MEDVKEINLHIDDEVFKVKREMLSEHSDYFRAMFSGNYVENQQYDITIDVVDANAMQIILKYMEIGLVDLAEFSLPVIGNLATATTFLQMTELMKQIEYYLDLQLDMSNWIEIMMIAENCSFAKLSEHSAAFGLLSFKTMNPEYIPTIDKLFWYLSHPSLDTDNELDVFKFGHKWVIHTETGADALLIILSCLDVRKVTRHDLEEIELLMKEYENSLVAKVVESMKKLCEQYSEISVPVITSNRESLCQDFTERVYNEVFNIVKESKERTLKYTAAVPVWIVKESKLEYVSHRMYTFSPEKGFESWLEVAEKNVWGWNIVAWGANRLVLVCGENGRGTGCFMRDVKVYDTLRKEWTWHGVRLPSRRHGGVTVVGDSLFVIGGVGGFRVVQDTGIIYDLKIRAYRKIAKLPDPLQSPAICTHEGTVYAAGQKNIYKYEDLGNIDRWTTEVLTEMRTSRMTSFKGYIYCTQNYFSHLYRFRPGIDKKLEIIMHFSHPAAAICNFGNRLMVFTRPMCGQPELLSVEEYTGTSSEEKPKVMWTEQGTETDNIAVNDIAGACTLVMAIASPQAEVSKYHQKYITRYSKITYEK